MADLLAWVEAHQGTAAWVQAVFSVIAILAAALIPMWHERRKAEEQKKVWLSNLSSLATEVRVMSEEVSAAYASDSGLLGACFEGDRDQYTPLLAAIESFPMPGHANRRHMKYFLRLKGLASVWDTKWRAAVDYGEAMVREPSHDEDEHASRLGWLKKSTDDVVADISKN